jgi:hypothetical protein
MPHVLACLCIISMVGTVVVEIESEREVSIECWLHCLTKGSQHASAATHC